MTKQEILSKYAQDRTRCTVYTRVMGYHRPVETFNAGKQGEFHDRVKIRKFVDDGSGACGRNGCGDDMTEKWSRC